MAYSKQDDKFIITMEQTDGKKMVTELSWEAGMDDVLEAFYGMCVGLTWAPVTVLEAMKDFADERLDNGTVVED